MWATSRGLLKLLTTFFLLVNALVWWAASRAMRPVERILLALGELRRGNLAARLPQFDLPELSRISIGFNHMAATLEESVTENQRLTRRLLETQETERTSLARELHDEIGQCVSAIHADAAAIRNRGGETVRESAEAIVEVTGHIKQIVRSMLQRLRPPVLEGLGLAPALRELVGAFQQRNPEVVCSLKTAGDLTLIDGDVAIAVYRVIQECLTNIRVHANAQRAAVDVHGDPAGGVPRVLRLTVIDDGIGFFLDSANRGFGLTGIRERVKVLGGTLEIGTEPGRGTRIAATIPLSRAS
jgi:two-component system sensor histidine kinase UhpB